MHTAYPDLCTSPLTTYTPVANYVGASPFGVHENWSALQFEILGAQSIPVNCFPTPYSVCLSDYRYFPASPI